MVWVLHFIPIAYVSLIKKNILKVVVPLQQKAGPNILHHFCYKSQQLLGELSSKDVVWYLPKRRNHKMSKPLAPPLMQG